MPRSSRQFSGEPLLRDVLADPIVLAVMARDGTARIELEILIATVRHRLANARLAGEDPANMRDVG